MSFFGQIAETSRNKSTNEDIEDLPRFEYKSLQYKDEIARGGFASVFTALLPSSEKIVVKKHLDADELSRKSLLKAVRLLHSKGICIDQFAILLEYVYFDFAPVGVSEKVNSLA